MLLWLIWNDDQIHKIGKKVVKKGQKGQILLANFLEIWKNEAAEFGAQYRKNALEVIREEQITSLKKD